MTIDGTELIQHIDEMCARLAQTAHSERSLVESLEDQLNRLDQEILQSIRNVAAGHETRRVAILNELQALAGSIGTFPPGRERVESIRHIAGQRASARPRWRRLAPSDKNLELPRRVRFPHPKWPSPSWQKLTTLRHGAQ